MNTAVTARTLATCQHLLQQPHWGLLAPRSHQSHCLEGCRPRGMMRTTCIQRAASHGDKETPCCTGSLQFSSRENRKALAEFAASRKKKTSNRLPPLQPSPRIWSATSRLLAEIQRPDKLAGTCRSIKAPAGASRKISGLHSVVPKRGWVLL